MPIDIVAMTQTIKLVAGVAKEAGKIELYQQVIDLQQGMIDAVAENTSLASENAALARQVRELTDQVEGLRRQLSRREEMAFRDDMYYTMVGGDRKDGPFCPRCLDDDMKAMRMTDRGNGFICCVKCTYSVRTPGYVAPIAHF